MPPPRLAVFACLVLGAGLACNSDDLDFVEPATTTGIVGTSTTTLTPTTTTGATDTDSTSSSSTIVYETTGGESTDGTTDVPPPQTCRDVLMCVGECALTLDLECFQMCGEGLQPDEAAKAAQLGLCVGQNCFESGTCSPETLMEPACLACIGIGILSPKPPGCEEQAEACT